MPEELQQGFELGEFLIRPMQGTASGPGGVHHLPPLAMEVLLRLAREPGTVVTRQALLSEVWGDAQGSDGSLTRCVSELRHQLGDHREIPTYIQTLPRRGYRLVAPISSFSESDPSNLPRDAPAFPTPGAREAPNPPRSIGEWIADLKRRRVFRVALIYLVCAWSIIQISETTFPALLIPLWGQTLVIVLAMIGFPIAMILTWAFQITPDGIKADFSTPFVNPLRGRSKAAYIAVASLIAVIGFLGAQLLATEDDAPHSISSPSEANATGWLGAAEEPADSIAVLPFVNLSGDSRNEYFSDGLSEEILNLLARLKELKVSAWKSSLYFKNKDVDIRTVAAHLGVRHVLEGSVRRAGKRVRVNAQLIRAETGFQIWSDHYDREIKDIFRIQSDIAHDVVRALDLVLSSSSGAQLERQSTTSVEAYEYYLQARSYLRNADANSDLDSAETLFKKAVASDVGYAEAYAGLCDTYLIRYQLLRSTRLFEQAERACHRALTLDSAAGDVYTAIGNLYRHSGQYHKAEQSFKRAIALNASAVSAYDGLAQNYQKQGRLDDAERTYQRAIEVEPRFWRGYLSMGNFLFSIGKPAEAIEYYLRVTHLMPDNSTGYIDLGSAYYMTGHFEKAAAAWQHSIELLPSKYAYANIGSSYFFLGRFEDAIEMYERAIELGPEDFESWGALGDACRFAGGHDERARQAYSKAIELVQGALQVNPSDTNATVLLAQYHANMDEPERAKALLAEVLKRDPQDMYVFYNAAVTNVRLGEMDEGLTAIEKAVGFGYPVDLLALDAGLSPLKKSERFAALLAKREAETSVRQ